MKFSPIFLAMTCWLTATLLSTKTGAVKSRDSSNERKLAEEECYPCEMLFSQLNGPLSSKRSQYVEMQLRGEPKSGTGFMHEWASGALYHTCSFLREAYGEDTCQMSWTKETPEALLNTKRALVFNPSRGGPGARCTCEGVGRVEISLSKLGKHTLPVDSTCRWWHDNWTARPSDKHNGCMSYRGESVAVHTDLWGCMAEAACNITDNRPQFVAMRDPRPMAVSTYYHRMRDGSIKNMRKEDFMMAVLPNICRWIATRHILFTGLIPEQSSVFWYEESLAKPRVFHTRFLEAVGLHLPGHVVERAVQAALLNDFDFFTKGIDVHPGGEEATLVRSWKDEVRPELLPKFDNVLRVWLPPAVLARLGVSGKIEGEE